MGTLRISSPDSNVIGHADIKVLRAYMVRSYWADENNRPYAEIRKENPSVQVRLGQTVHFIIETKDVVNGTRIDLTLKADKLLSPHEKINKQIIQKSGIFHNNIVTIELYLDEAWAGDIKKSYKIGRRFKLYWTIDNTGLFFDDALLHDGFLDVSYSKQDLFVRPSEADPGFPEMFTSSGELLVPVIVETTQEILEEVVENSAEKYPAKWIGNMTNKTVLAKLEKGYLMASDGKIYKRTDVIDKTYNKFSGEELTVKQAENFGFRTRQGKTYTKVTTKGVNQYEAFAHIAGQDAKIKFIGNFKGLAHSGGALDFVNILRFGMEGTKDDMLPLPGPLGLLNIPMKHHLDGIESVVNAQLEREALAKLEKAKTEGINAVYSFVNSKQGRDHRFRLFETNMDVAMRIYTGEITILDEAIIATKETPTNTTILYRVTEHGITGEAIYIIETIFIED